MRCWTTDGSGLDGLQMVERPGPSPGIGEVKVDVRAVSLNYRDLLVARGEYGGVQDPPIVAASDMAGVVSEIGPEVTQLVLGDRVLNAPVKDWVAGQLTRKWSQSFVGGQGVDGVLAEQLVYPADALVKLPHHFDFSEGCTLTIAGLTAWAAVVTHGHTAPGEWVLVHGTGGVSLFAAQLAKSIGARVILTTSKKEKAQLVLQRIGVDHTIDYRNDGWPKEVRALTDGHGVDVVVETAGGATLDSSIQSCGYGARVGVIGVLDGLHATLSVFQLIMHQVTLRGIYMESRVELQRLVQAVEAAQLRPWIDRVFEFQAANEAYEYLESGQHMGKVVIRRDR
jgi:NADPH:quinone reductase-like Zn-dependent oxidoreductase